MLAGPIGVHGHHHHVCVYALCMYNCEWEAQGGIESDSVPISSKKVAVVEVLCRTVF